MIAWHFVYLFDFSLEIAHLNASVSFPENYKIRQISNFIGNIECHLFSESHFSGGSLTLDDQDPLPNDDLPGIDEHLNHDLNTDCITINVSDETNGQKIRDPLDIR